MSGLALDESPSVLDEGARRHSVKRKGGKNGATQVLLQSTGLNRV